jgi:molybdopterin-guanine dinucleotide biosynthesis protein A
VVVLAGGSARRWGGRDKTAAVLAGRAVVLHVVEGARAVLGAAVPVVVVAPADHPAAGELVAGGARVVREDPPGGGPVAGLAAGLAAVPDDVDVVAVVAGDVPFGGPALQRTTRALRADGTLDAVVGADPLGRRQPLLGSYRTAALRTALAAAPVDGRSVRSVLGALTVAVAPVDTREALDLDTPEDLAVAAALLDPR